MTLFPESILEKSARLIDACRKAGLRVVTAESCTGGLIAAALTEIPGSSDVVGRGFVTYANDAKAELLGVPLDAIRAHGAVSEPVARAMAEGALADAPAEISIGVTGIAGPGGGSPDRPVGTVQLAAARRGRETVCQRKHFDGGRTAVRLATVEAALDMMLARID